MKISTDRLYRINKLLNYIVFGPSIIIFALLFIFSWIKFFIEINKTNDYIKTNAYYKSYSNCTYYEEDNHKCDVLYEYEVNKEIYSITIPTVGSPNNYLKERTVFYNPDKPEDSFIPKGINLYMFFGGIILIVCFFALYMKNKIFKRILGNRDSISIDKFINK